jgi:alkylmercury lyase
MLYGHSMATPTVEDLRRFWTTRSDFGADRTGLVVANLIAEGKPATPEALAAETGLGIEDVTAGIEAARQHGVEVENGAIVGAALTLRPTQHRFRVRGHALYTWCGFDALFLPIALGERAEAGSRCPVTGTEIRLIVEPDGTVSAVTPASVVVGIVGDEVASSCASTGPASAVCTQMPFFASRDTGERWLADHPGVAIVDLDEARMVARAYVEAMVARP